MGKATALNLVVSDKGKKAIRIGKAFVDMDGGPTGKSPPVSCTINLAELRKALGDGTITEQTFTGNPQYPDPVLDGNKVIRIAGFKITRKGSI